MKLFLVPVLLFSSFSLAQAPSNVSVKSSPASDALVKAAQELVTEQKSFDTMISQARSASEASQKSLQAEIQKANAELQAELKSDKKYKGKLNKIDTMLKQLQSSQQEAQSKFTQESSPIQSAIYKDKALIEGLSPVVRKENNLPADATFDPVTQKWTSPKHE